MLTNLLILYIGLVVFSFCLRLFFYDPNLLPKSKTSSVSVQNKSAGNPGDWVVTMRKPRREITVTGCNTDGEAVRKIILMGHSIDNIKDTVQL